MKNPPYSKNRVPRQRDGILEARYARSKDDGSNLFLVWGEGCSKSDAHMLSSQLGPIFDELVKRGYNADSFRFSIKKAPTAPGPSED